MNTDRDFIPSEEYKPLDNQLSIDDLQPQCKTSNNEIEPSPKNKKSIKKYFPYVCLVCLICSLLGNINLYYANIQTQESLKNMRAWKNWAEKQNDDLFATILEIRPSYDFYNQHAAIITEYGNRYHRYGCYHLDDMDSFWIYNVEAAKSEGYIPCKDCWR